jgi:hypothetical protein
MLRSVDQYLLQLPEDRRQVVSLVRDLVLLHLPDGYRESINWGMIAYEIPLERYPNTYNGQPLSYVAVASQKDHVGLYLMGTGVDPAQRAQLKTAFANAGKKLDMGKACLRFKTLDDLPIAAVAQVIASMPPEVYIERYEAVRSAQPTTTRLRKAKAKKTETARVTKSATARAAKRRATKTKATAKKTKSPTRKARKAAGARATRVTRQGRTRRRS